MSKYRPLLAQSFIEQKRDGVQIGERWYLIVPDAQSGDGDDSAAPLSGEPYDDSHPDCLLTSFKRNQYKDNQHECLVCYYTSEETFDDRLQLPVPKPRMTMGGEILSLSKGYTATWGTAPNDPVNQVLQKLVCGAQLEIWECFADWSDAQEFMFFRVGTMDAGAGQWLCISANPQEGISVPFGEAIDGEDAGTWHVRVKWQFAWRENPWNKLFRESTGTWDTISIPLYDIVNDSYDFKSLCNPASYRST